MNDQFKRIVKLIQKTGDKMVVYNENEPDSSYVVMGFDAYEKSVGESHVKNLTEEEMLDKINRDIAVWKNEQEIKEEAHFPAEKDAKMSSFGVKKRWAISEDVKGAADEVIEEDRQYLEDVVF